MNTELTFLNQENPDLMALYQKNPLQVNSWFQQNITKLEELQGKSYQLLQNFSRVSAISRPIEYQSKINNLNIQQLKISEVLAGIEYDGTLFLSGANTTLQNYTQVEECQGQQYSYDPRCRYWYTKTKQQESLYIFEPRLLYTSFTPFYGFLACQKAEIFNYDKNSSELFSVFCLDTEISEMQNYFQNFVSSTEQVYFIEPRSQAILFNSKNQKISSIDKLYDIEIKYLDSKQDAQYFNDTINQNYSVWTQKKVNQITISEILDLHSNQTVFEYNRNSTKTIVLMNPIYVFDQLPRKNKSSGFYDVNIDIQLAFLHINILSDEQLKQQSLILEKYFDQYFVFLSVVLGVICLISIIYIVIQALRIKYMLNESFEILTNILKNMSQEDLQNIDFGESNEGLLLSWETYQLYESFKGIYQILLFSSENFFQDNETQTLLKLHRNIEFFKKFGNIQAVGITLNNIGSILLSQEHHFQALEYFQSSIVYAKYEIQEFCNQNPQTISAMQLNEFGFNKLLFIQNEEQVVEKKQKEIENLYNDSKLKHLLKVKRGKLKKIYKKEDEQYSLNMKTASQDDKGQLTQKNIVSSNLKDFCNSVNSKSNLSKFEGEEQNEQKIYLLNNLYSRQKNYIVALLSFQENLEKNQSNKMYSQNGLNSFNFWNEIKILSKELLVVSKQLPRNQYLDTVIKAYISKCQFKLNKEQKAFKILQQCENYSKLQQSKKSICRLVNKKQSNFFSKKENETPQSNNTTQNQNFKTEDQLSQKPSGIRFLEQKFINDSLQNQQNKNFLNINRSSYLKNTKQDTSSQINLNNTFSQNNSPYDRNQSFDFSTVSAKTFKKYPQQDNLDFNYSSKVNLNLENTKYKINANSPKDHSFKWDAQKLDYQKGDNNFEMFNELSMEDLEIQKNDSNDVVNDKNVFTQQAQYFKKFNQRSKTQHQSIQALDQVQQTNLKQKSQKSSVIGDKYSVQNRKRNDTRKSRAELYNYFVNINNNKNEFSYITNLDESRDIESVFELKRKEESYFYQRFYIQKYFTQQAVDQIIQYVKCEMLYLKQNYYQSALAITELFEQKQFFISHLPFKLIYLLKTIFEKFQLYSQDFEKIFRKFNPNIKMQIAMVFACKENNQILKSAELASNLISNLLNEVNDQFGVVLINASDNYIQSYMSLTKVSQIKNNMKSIIQDILSYTSNSDKNFLYDLLIQHQSNIKQEGDKEQKQDAIDGSINKSKKFNQDQESKQQINQYNSPEQKMTIIINQIDKQNSQINASNNTYNLYSNNNLSQNYINVTNNNMQNFNMDGSVNTFKFTNQNMSYNDISPSITATPIKNFDSIKPNKFSFDQKSIAEQNFDMNVSNNYYPKVQKINLQPIVLEEVNDLNISLPTLDMQNSIGYQLSKEEDNKYVSNNSLFHLSIRKTLTQVFSDQIQYNFNLQQTVNKKKQTFSECIGKEIYNTWSQQRYIIYSCDEINIINNNIFQNLCNTLSLLNIQIIIYSNNKGNNFLEQQPQQIYYFQSRDIIRIFYSHQSLITYLKSCRDKFNRQVHPSIIQHF